MSLTVALLHQLSLAELWLPKTETALSLQLSWCQSRWWTGSASAEGQVQHALVMIGSVPHLRSQPYTHSWQCKERYRSPGGLSHGSPCHPAAKKSPVKQGQDGGRLPGCSSQSRGLARAAADLEGGVERKGREDTHVSRHCLRGTSVSLLKMAKSEHFQMFHSPDYLPHICALKS